MFGGAGSIHRLPGRVGTSESSSDHAPKPSPQKKPSMKRPASAVHDHCPLGGNNTDDDSRDPPDGFDESEPAVPKDLQPRKRPATAAKNKPTAKSSKKKETLTCSFSFLVTFVMTSKLKCQPLANLSSSSYR